MKACVSEGAVIYFNTSNNAMRVAYPNPRLAHATLALAFVNKLLQTVPHLPE